MVLAGADFPGKHNEPLTALHAVNQVCQCLLMLCAAIQKTRIGTQIEGALDKTEVGVVHNQSDGMHARCKISSQLLEW